jgi:hypothetical protein
VTIASSAAIYQPTYYLAVGWVNHFLDGYAGLYAMRIVSGLLCAALWGVTVWVITGWARTMWPLVAVAVVLTPTTLYGLAIVAPNGLELALAMALWACLIGSVRVTNSMHRAHLLALAIPLAGVFAWVRPLGPIWLFFILAAWVVLLGPRGVRVLLENHRRLVVVAAVVIAVCALTSAHWVLTHTTGEPADVYDIRGTRWGQTVRQIPLWFLQVISGVPFRNTPATFDVYVAGLIVFAFLLLPLLRCRTPRVRMAAITTVVSALGVAIWYTYSRLPTAGPLWQGRYAWCLALGVVLLAGLALEDRKLQTTKTVALLFAIPSLVIMHLRCLVFVLRIETRESPLTNGEWFTASAAVVLALAVTGLAMWFVGLSLTHRELSPAARTPTHETRDSVPGCTESPIPGREA